VNGPVWLNFALVALGGAIGTAGRYAVNLWFGSRFGPDWTWPWHTFTINIAGSLLIGVVSGLAVTGTWGVGPNAKVVLAVGVLGGFTTFSSFAFELHTMAIDSGRALAAFGYAASSVVVGFGAAAAGIALARLLR